MTELLEQAFDKASAELSESEQDLLARMLLDRLDELLVEARQTGIDPSRNARIQEAKQEARKRLRKEGSTLIAEG